MFVNTDVNAMNWSTYVHDPMLCAFLTWGLFYSFSNLNKSDLASKYMKMIDRNDAIGNAAIYNYIKHCCYLTGKKRDVAECDDHLKIFIKSLMLHKFELLFLRMSNLFCEWLFLLSFSYLLFLSFLVPLGYIWDDGLKEYSPDLIYHKEKSEVLSEQVDSQLVQTDVEQVQEVIAEHKGESFNDKWIVESRLCAVVLNLSSMVGNLLKPYSEHYRDHYLHNSW